MVSKLNGEHFVWKTVCDGWHLAKSDDLSVIHERMPAHTAEDRHLHKKVRQFFFVLRGEATFELEGNLEQLRALEGLEISPGLAHQIRNDSDHELEFLVISSDLARNDRHPA